MGIGCFREQQGLSVKVAHQHNSGEPADPSLMHKFYAVWNPSETQSSKDSWLSKKKKKQKVIFTFSPLSSFPRNDITQAGGDRAAQGWISKTEHGKVTMTAPGAMWIGETKLHGRIAINQPVLIKAAHLFCIEAPANEVASLNCGMCRAIRGAGVTGEKRDNLAPMYFNVTSKQAVWEAGCLRRNINKTLKSDWMNNNFPTNILPYYFFFYCQHIHWSDQNLKLVGPVKQCWVCIFFLCAMELNCL